MTQSEIKCLFALKWIEQCNIKSETLENKAQDVIKWAKSLGQRGGFTTEHFFGAPDDLVTRTSFNFGTELPRLDEKDRSEKESRYGLVVSQETYCGIYADLENNLVFAYEPRSKISPPEKKVELRFMPEEADHLVKGILYQSAMGLGRTSAAQLVAMLEYRFSPRYDSDLKEFSR